MSALSYTLRLKEKVLDHYGRVCKCCGETEPLFLTIDHVNNDGAIGKKNCIGGRSGGSTKIYLEIIRNNFPSTFQTLCWNCNAGKYRNGGICPHVTSGNSIIGKTLARMC